MSRILSCLEPWYIIFAPNRSLLPHSHTSIILLPKHSDEVNMFGLAKYHLKARHD
jgi:hypothetical protein